MKFGICNEIFDGWGIDDTFAFAAHAGYDAVELAPFTLARSVTEISAAQRAALRESATRAGIAISGLHWVLVKTEGLHLTSSDSAVRERTARYFVELVECCADVGGTRIVLGSPKQRSVGEGIAHAQARAWARAALSDAVRCAEDRGVTICFEPLAPSETNFINTAADAIRFAGEFASPAMSVILDVKAMCSEEKPIPQIIRESAGRFVHFHANDSNLKGPGFGDVDFRPILGALNQSGYGGIVSVEVFDFTEGSEAIATRSIAYLRETLSAV